MHVVGKSPQSSQLRMYVSKSGRHKIIVPFQSGVESSIACPLYVLYGVKCWRQIILNNKLHKKADTVVC